MHSFVDQNGTVLVRVVGAAYVLSRNLHSLL